MKTRKPLILSLLVAAGVCMWGRQPVLEPSYSWTLVDQLGLRRPSTIDTLYDDYSLRFVPSGISAAYATTGNYGAEGKNMIYSERKNTSDFFFRDALNPWLPSFQKTKFYNTRIPMTLLSYNFGGGKQDAQERLHGIFSGNINKKAQVGALLDYIYSKGSYENQAVKNLNWGFSGSYIGDRYEFQGFYYHYNSVNKENGGIADMLWITDPAELQGGVDKVNAKSIPTNLNDAHTRLAGGQLFLNNRYKIGYWHEEQVDDSTVNRSYIPVTSLIWSLDFRNGRHSFNDPSTAETRDFFEHTYLDPYQTHDRTSYWSLRNTLGISLLEGFHKYAKFGLAGYITHEIRRYNQTADTLDKTNPDFGLDPFPAGIVSIAPNTTENLVWVGGQLTKQQGAILTYRANAEFGLVGPAAGDIRLDGEINTRFPLVGDSLRLTAYGTFLNESAPYLMKNYLSNHFIWHNDFGKERTVRFGGRLDYDRTYTSLEASATNLQNHIYFGPDFTPHQHGSNVQILSLRLRQDIHTGPFNWENSITYQTSSDQSVVPLPKLAFYSNLYFKFRIATLFVQAGIDCDYYTSYNAPAYQPALATFANQNEVKLGNYPFMNLYLNFKLSRTRFYVMMSHINQGILGGNNYFSAVNYPLNPRRLQMGISVDFAN